MMTDIRVIVGFGWNLIVLSLPLGAATCESLVSLKLTNTSITAAQVVSAGAFLPPGQAPNPAIMELYKSLRAFCRVQGVMRPSSDSHIEFEVWLPSSGWNDSIWASATAVLQGRSATRPCPVPTLRV